MGRWLLLAGLLTAFGCNSMQKQVRSQAGDEADHDHEIVVRTIGELTSVGNAAAIPVIGVGLVTGLAGTGGGVPPGNERAALENDLKKRGVENINELFSSNTTALVRVSGYVPAGSKKGGIVDLAVNVPEASRTSSLRGGTLESCLLYDFASSQNLRPDPTRPDRLLRGHPWVKAEGPILVGLPGDGGEDEDSSLKAGRVWGGGRILGNDRAFTLELNEPSPRVAMRIAERVNETFHGPAVLASTAPLANASTKTTVTLNVPGTYRLNLARYLRVVRCIPLTETPAADSAYAQKLERQLVDPATTVTAALRLEALGHGSIPVLKRALHSSDPLVRFSAVESLAYLGSPSCAEELARQIVEHPYVAAFALTGLASLNESICRVKLEELLSAPTPEVRFGAYRALQEMDGKELARFGKKLNESFWLCEVAPGTNPQVHLTTSKRPEVVLFGSTPKLEGPFSLLIGSEFTLTAHDTTHECVLSRFTARSGKEQRACKCDVSEVLRALADLGGDYGDAVELLRQAADARVLNCAVKVDALPKAPLVNELAKAGLPGTRGAGSDLGGTPTLFEKGESGR